MLFLKISWDLTSTKNQQDFEGTVSESGGFASSEVGEKSMINWDLTANNGISNGFHMLTYSTDKMGALLRFERNISIIWFCYVLLHQFRARKPIGKSWL